MEKQAQGDGAGIAVDATLPAFGFGRRRREDLARDQALPFGGGHLRQAEAEEFKTFEISGVAEERSIREEECREVGGFEGAGRTWPPREGRKGSLGRGGEEGRVGFGGRGEGFGDRGLGGVEGPRALAELGEAFGREEAVVVHRMALKDLGVSVFGTLGIELSGLFLEGAGGKVQGGWSFGSGRIVGSQLAEVLDRVVPTLLAVVLPCQTPQGEDDHIALGVGIDDRLIGLTGFVGGGGIVEDFGDLEESIVGEEVLGVALDQAAEGSDPGGRTTDPAEGLGEEEEGFRFVFFETLAGFGGAAQEGDGLAVLSEAEPGKTPVVGPTAEESLVRFGRDRDGIEDLEGFFVRKKAIIDGPTKDLLQGGKGKGWRTLFDPRFSFDGFGRVRGFDQELFEPRDHGFAVGLALKTSMGEGGKPPCRGLLFEEVRVLKGGKNVVRASGFPMEGCGLKAGKAEHPGSLGDREVKRDGLGFGAVFFEGLGLPEGEVIREERKFFGEDGEDLTGLRGFAFVAPAQADPEAGGAEGQGRGFELLGFVFGDIATPVL